MGILFCRTRSSFKTSTTKRIKPYITVEQWSFARGQKSDCVLNTKTICEEEANKTGFTAIVFFQSWVYEFLKTWSVVSYSNSFKR